MCRNSTPTTPLLILLAELRERLLNFEFDKVVEYAKELSDKYAIKKFDVGGTAGQRRLPEKLRDACLTSSVGHPEASNFEELSILIHQNVGEILAELDSRFGAVQAGIMRAAACAL